MAELTFANPRVHARARGTNTAQNMWHAYADMCHSTSACRPARARSARNAREYLAAPCCASSAVSWTLVVCPHVRDERGSVDVGNSVRDRCSGKAERAGRVRARIVSPCPGPQRSLALAAAAARRNSSESTPEKSALPRIAGDGMQTARARFSSRLSGRTCGSGAAAAPRKPASIDAPLERASSVARLRFHPIAISRMKAAQTMAPVGPITVK